MGESPYRMSEIDPDSIPNLPTKDFPCGEYERGR